MVDIAKVKIGLYHVFWKDGGSSLASVGMTKDGGKWLAPINWVAPTENQDHWKLVDRLQLIKTKKYENCIYS